MSTSNLAIARLASTGRLATACALHLHRLAASSPRDMMAIASDLTRQLLTVAHRSADDAATSIDIGELVDEFRGLLAILAGPGAIVVTVRDAPRVRTIVNRGDIEQVLINLVESAPALTSETLPRRLSITTGIFDGRFAMIAFDDDQWIERREQPARQTEACHACGAIPELGLPLVRAIVASYGGRLDSGVDQRVMLPLA